MRQTLFLMLLIFASSVFSHFKISASVHLPAGVAKFYSNFLFWLRSFCFQLAFFFPMHISCQCCCCNIWDLTVTFFLWFFLRNTRNVSWFFHCFYPQCHMCCCCCYCFWQCADCQLFWTPFLFDFIANSSVGNFQQHLLLQFAADFAYCCYCFPLYFFGCFLLTNISQMSSGTRDILV